MLYSFIWSLIYPRPPAKEFIATRVINTPEAPSLMQGCLPEISLKRNGLRSISFKLDMNKYALNNVQNFSVRYVAEDGSDSFLQQSISTVIVPKSHGALEPVTLIPSNIDNHEIISNWDSFQTKTYDKISYISCQTVEAMLSNGQIWHAGEPWPPWTGWPIAPIQKENPAQKWEKFLDAGLWENSTRLTGNIAFGNVKIPLTINKKTCRYMDYMTLGSADFFMQLANYSITAFRCQGVVFLGRNLEYCHLFFPDQLHITFTRNF